MSNYHSNIIGPTESQNYSVDEAIIRVLQRLESRVIQTSRTLHLRKDHDPKTQNLLFCQLGLQQTRYSEVVAPILCHPPTDHASLYTTLKLTQDISAMIVRPSRKTIITLDMDLFQRVMKIKFIVDNENWILCLGELHI